MHYQPRTIAFHCDLFHPPLKVDPRPIQRLHNEMFESGQPLYSSFAVTPQGPVLSNPVARPGAVSQVSFLPDRFQFREELGSLTIEGFAERVRFVAEKVATLRGLQLFTGQQVTIRSLINPHNFKDSRAFLKEAMFGFGEESQVLGREPQLYGLRLAFPPSGEETEAYVVRIESFNGDPRSLFLENQGTFGPLMLGRGFDLVHERVEQPYKFLLERVLPFVARFEPRQEA